MYCVAKQKELIYKREWDVLFIIDACRFDVFRDIYKDFFPDAELKKALSPATWTYGWLLNIFYGEKSFKDTIFISSDYEVNSKGIRDEKIYDWKKRKEVNGREIKAKDVFFKVIDVWEEGFDDKIGIVHPRTICDETIKVSKKHKKRIIANFWQLHDPYLYYLMKGNGKIYNMEDKERRNKMVYRWVNLKRFIGHFFSDEFLWTIQKGIGNVPDSGLAYYWMKYGREGIKKAYEEDLKITLWFIKKVVKETKNKKIVITSDHGELLGEHKRYGHTANKDYMELKEVPWLEIQN